MKNTGTACAGAVKGLTRIRTIIKDVTDSSADKLIPNKREFTTFIVMKE